jgi:hypothetical protein
MILPYFNYSFYKERQFCLFAKVKQISLFQDAAPPWIASGASGDFGCNLLAHPESFCFLGYSFG